MTFYIKIWPDNTATLMTQWGQVLWTFPNPDEAMAACREWYALHEVRTEYESVTPDDLHEKVPFGW